MIQVDTDISRKYETFSHPLVMFQEAKEELLNLSHPLIVAGGRRGVGRGSAAGGGHRNELSQLNISCRNSGCKFSSYCRMQRKSGPRRSGWRRPSPWGTWCKRAATARSCSASMHILVVLLPAAWLCKDAAEDVLRHGQALIALRAARLAHCSRQICHQYAAAPSSCANMPS